MKKEAEEEWEEFAASIPEIRQHDLQCAFTFSRGNNVSQTIYNYALRQKKDLILISTKGKGALTSFVIGSVANRLLQHDLHVPLLVVKK
jgi:nucleotide-binding universal stress UspA family protein